MSCHVIIALENARRTPNLSLVIFAYRRMFPTLQFRLKGLEANSRYTVVMEMLLSSSTQWKYQSGKWIPSGQMDSHIPQGKPPVYTLTKYNYYTFILICELILNKYLIEKLLQFN